MTDKKPHYAVLPPEQPAREMEEALLQRWREERLFEQTLAQHADKPRWVFLEGPPRLQGDTWFVATRAA